MYPHRSSSVAILLFLLILLFGCGRRQEPALRTEDRILAPDPARVSRPFLLAVPTYHHVADPHVDPLASAVFTEVAASHYAAAASYSPALLDLLGPHAPDLDRPARLALFGACAQAYDARRRSENDGAALRFIDACAGRWSTHWPDDDSLLAEAGVLAGNSLKGMKDPAGAGTRYLEAMDHMLRAGHGSRASAIAIQAARVSLDLHDAQGARDLFARALALATATTPPDTNQVVDAIISSIPATPDSIAERLTSVERWLPGITSPLVASRYYSWKGLHLAQTDRAQLGIGYFKNAVLTLDTLRLRSLMEFDNLAGYLHNTAFALRNGGRMVESRSYASRAVHLNEWLIANGDPEARYKAIRNIVGNLEILPFEDSTLAKYGGEIGCQMTALRFRLGMPVIDSGGVANSMYNIATKYFYWDEAGLDSVYKYATLCLQWTPGHQSARAYHLQAHCHAHRSEHEAALACLEQAMRLYAEGNVFTWGTLERTRFPISVKRARDLGEVEEVLEALESDPTFGRHGLLAAVSEKQEAIIDSLFMIPGIDLRDLVESRMLMDRRLMRSAWPRADSTAGAERTARSFAFMDDDKAMLFRRDRFIASQQARSTVRQQLRALEEQHEALRTSSSNVPLLMRTEQLIDSLNGLLADVKPEGVPPTSTRFDLLHRVQGGLRAHEALIEYCLTKNELLTILVAPDTVVFARQDRTGPIDGALAIMTGGTTTAAGNEQTLDSALRILADRLLPDPLWSMDIDALIVVPSEALSYVPFDALPARGGNDRTRLIDRMRVRLALSAEVSTHDRLRVTRDEAAEVLAFAPDYGPSTDGGGNDRSLCSANSLLDTAQRRSALPLIHNVEEARAIARLVASDLFVDEASSEQAFKSNLGHPGVLHLAMHAYSADDPARSGLVFAEGTSASGNDRGISSSAQNENGPLLPDDGVFHAYELLSRTVRADLVVLSACETGHGPYQAGEGVGSIARSFMQAGAGSVVCSLWKVDDRATKEIMVNFYEHLADGEGKADALAAAKRAYRLEHPDASPSKWAAFILIGDNAPVHLKKRRAVRPWMWGGAVVAVVVALAARRRRMLRTTA